MRPASSRLFALVASTLVAAVALAQAATGGFDRDLVARRTRVGMQRLDADGGHGLVETAEGPSIAAAIPTTSDTAPPQSSPIASLPVRVTWLPAAGFVQLPLFQPSTIAPASVPRMARGRAPPSA
jgi:hypothetical protein